MSFRIGDRVILVGNERITPTQSWPVWNSKHECMGTVISTVTERRYAEPSVTKVGVQWDNSQRNTHLEELLAGTLSKEKLRIEPNRAFRRRKSKHRETIDGRAYKVRCACGYERYTSLSVNMLHTIVCANCEGAGGFSIRSVTPP